MELSKLINSLKAIQVTGVVERKDVESVVCDSQKVKRNTMFVAVSGFSVDGHKYIMDAVNAGASAVVLEKDDVVADDFFLHNNVTKILVRNSREALSRVSNAFYHEPSKKLTLLGITGTKGKTTTSYYVKNILQTAGYKTGLIGTIANYVGDIELKTTLTTPESNELHRLMADMVREGCSHCVMEVSSHSLALNRVNDLSFKGAVFTNLTSDHLDFHKTREEYLAAKKILFDILDDSAAALYNFDDESAKKIVANSKAKTFSYGIGKGADFLLSDVEYDLDGTRFSVKHGGLEYDLTTTLVGEFNAYNAAAAFAICILTGIKPEIALEGIRTTPQVPGRFEAVAAGKKKIIVDYSHTADSLEKALQALHKITGAKRKIYTVFGCGGNRDKTKRPIMGEIASRYSDKAIVTSDNPRFEEPLEIIKDITAGIKKSNYEVIESREEAIKKAVQNSEEDAVILIAGKGHETYQEIKGVRSHFSDKEIAEKYLNK